jgi:hypothetical protein
VNFRRRANAKSCVETKSHLMRIATGEIEEALTDDGKSAAAVAQVDWFGRRPTGTRLAAMR